MNVDQFMPNRDQKFAHIVARIPSGWGRWIDVGPGWHDLVLELDAKMAEVDPDYELHQCKEKFGGLRYYIGHAHNDACGGLEEGEGSIFERCKILVLEMEYERKSLTMCETCGAPGVLRSGGWLRTLCDEHANGHEPAHFDWDIVPGEVTAKAPDGNITVKAQANDAPSDVGA